MGANIPENWRQRLPLHIRGADLYVRQFAGRLPRAAYESCRIYIVGGDGGPDFCFVAEYGSIFYECFFITHSEFTPDSPAPPRDREFVGNRGGQVLSLVRKEQGP